MLTPDQSSEDIFNRYIAVQQRLPALRRHPQTQNISSLLDLTDQIDAFVFDAFGVLNVGETAIPGAVERIAQLRDAGAEIRVLTNSATFTKAATLLKFQRLGFSFLPDEIITSRSSALRVLDDRNWGVMTARDDSLEDIPYGHIRLGDRPQDFDAVEGFLFLSTADWTGQHQEILEATLAHKPRRLVIANADLAAPRDYAFSLEPGFWGHQIADKLSVEVEFHGKPFHGVFDLAAQTLARVEPSRIALCGDSLHTDVLGANGAGWRSVFVVQDGLFRQLDSADMFAATQIQPDWMVSRI